MASTSEKTTMKSRRRLSRICSESIGSMFRFGDLALRRRQTGSIWADLRPISDLIVRISTLRRKSALKVLVGTEFLISYD